MGQALVYDPFGLNATFTDLSGAMLRYDQHDKATTI